MQWKCRRQLWSSQNSRLYTTLGSVHTARPGHQTGTKTRRGRRFIGILWRATVVTLTQCDDAGKTRYWWQLEGTHRVGTHAVLLLTLTLTLTFDLSTQNHATCRISQGHFLYHVWTLWDHSFLSYAATNRQTDKQTDTKILPTPTDTVGMGN